jgi:hypothetical protein
MINLIGGQAQNILLPWNVLREASVVTDDRSGLQISSRRNRHLLSGDEPLDILTTGRCSKRARVSKTKNRQRALLFLACLVDLRLEVTLVKKRYNLGHLERLDVSGLSQGCNLIHRVENRRNDSGFLSRGARLPLARLPGLESIRIGRSIVKIDENTDDSEFLILTCVNHVHLHGQASAIVDVLAGKMEVKLLKMICCVFDGDFTAESFGDYFNGASQVLELSALGEVGDLNV